MEDKKNSLIAYCGLYCGDCFSYQGKIADLARDLRKELRKVKFEKIALGLSKYFKEFNDFEKCYQVLGAMVRLRCKKACRNGGGNPFCKIRNCCQKKKLLGCWKCKDFERCEKIKSLEVVHEEANIKNLRKIKKQGEEQFLKGKKYW